MRLYHFTSIRHMRNILKTGAIRTTYSDIQPDGAGPGVVWLTSNPDPKQGWAAGEAPNFLYEKHGIRITVEIPDREAHHYPEWARKMGIDPKWFKLYTERDATFGDWYVVTRPVGPTEWRDVEMWEGFQSAGTQGYSRRMYESFAVFLSGTEVQAWILEAMNRDLEEGEGVPPVSVEEWMKMGAARKRGADKTEKLLAELRGAGGGKKKKGR